ncbi:hypothetical protein [Methylomonas koyamae]|uniref:hypothetical protein n=1 Tax=Methylomonas koyamae TaxID=702114 RepID=UPI001E583148|nr:hypothetical protein [Methylomonas koyamae]
MNNSITSNKHGIPWNKGKIVGQKYPLKFKEIWAIRIRLQLAHQVKELVQIWSG